MLYEIFFRMSEVEPYTEEYIQEQLKDMNRYNPDNQVIFFLFVTHFDIKFSLCWKTMSCNRFEMEHMIWMAIWPCSSYINFIQILSDTR